MTDIVERLNQWRAKLATFYTESADELAALLSEAAALLTDLQDQDAGQYTKAHEALDDLARESIAVAEVRAAKAEAERDGWANATAQAMRERDAAEAERDEAQRVGDLIVSRRDLVSLMSAKDAAEERAERLAKAPQAMAHLLFRALERGQPINVQTIDRVLTLATERPEITAEDKAWAMEIAAALHSEDEAI